MCKHVAAALFGIGTRLDEDPALLFKLRKIDSRELLSQAVQDKSEELFKKSTAKSKLVIADDNLGALFGIDMDDKPDFAAAKTTAKKVKPTKTSPPPAPAKKKQTPQKQTATARIEEFITRRKGEVTVAMLAEKTGFPRRKIYAITSRLRQSGRIIYVAQGVYGRP